MAMNPRLLRPTKRFDPRSITGLEMYLNAKVASSLTLNTTNPNDPRVSEWRDLSGKGRHVSQATGANQPAFSVNGWLGRPCVAFTRGSNHTLAFTPFVMTTSTAFFVIEPTAAVPIDNRGDILNNNGSAAGQGNVYFFVNASGLRSYSAALGSAVTGTPGTVGVDLFAQSKMLLSHTYNGSGSTTIGNHGIRKDRVQQTIESVGIVGNVSNVGTIGGRTGTSVVALSARYAMVLLYNRVLSAAEIAAVENWAIAEYPLA